VWMNRCFRLWHSDRHWQIHSATGTTRMAGGAVSVAVYDDRLEIWSDGTTIRAAPGRSETRPSFTSTKSLDRRGVLSAGVGGTLGAGHAKTG
jgi:hypothetical protein